MFAESLIPFFEKGFIVVVMFFLMEVSPHVIAFPYAPNDKELSSRIRVCLL